MANLILNILIMKNLKNLGNALNKTEQKEITGGRPAWCGYCRCSDGSLVYGIGYTQQSACADVCESGIMI